MTATPIPRTLEMALAGIRQMSTIDTPPEDRQPVRTFVGSFDEELALGAVRRELLREGQVFWVHNRVATIDRQAARLQQQLPDARIVVAHGQMDEDQLERQMMRFWEREADVLVCTTIIESGLDVPNANTLDRRSRRPARAGADVPAARSRGPQRRARVRLLLLPASTGDDRGGARSAWRRSAQHQALGSGFKIALRDLEIRGAGNLLGAEQRGHIAAVGFDAYARILQESVREIQGEPIERGDGAADRPAGEGVHPAGLAGAGSAAARALPADRAWRAITKVSAMIRDETADRFGALPDAVQALFAIGSLRLTAQALGVEEIADVSATRCGSSRSRCPRSWSSDLSAGSQGATFLPSRRSTLNLVPERVFGKDSGRVRGAMAARSSHG